MIVAAFQHTLTPHENWQSFEQKIEALIKAAYERQAQLVVFPEYASLELVTLFSGSLGEQFHQLQNLLPNFQNFYQSLAKKYSLIIVAGTLPVLEKSGRFRNRAYLFTPEGKTAYQDKIILTPYERSTGLLESGTECTVFDTSLGKIAIAVCYDIEFPHLIWPLIEKGVELILVPSSTDNAAGFNRVHVGCRARALEGQCFVVQACNVGSFGDFDFLGETTGQAVVTGPIDISFSSDGILAKGIFGQAEMVVADLPIEKLSAVRREGQTRNHEDTKRVCQPHTGISCRVWEL